MPIYEYQCEKCQHHLEALQKYSDKPLRECPECGKHALRRLMSAPRFRLAGSGWYETDFKSDNENKRNLVEKDKEKEKEKVETPTAAASTSDTPAEKPAVAAKESPGKEASNGEATAKRRVVVNKTSKVSKPAAKPKAKPAFKPAASKRAVRTR